MALAHHDTSHRNQAKRPDAKFLSTKDCRDHDIATGFKAAIGAQLDPVTQAVEREYLVGFGQTHFPRRAGIFDAGLRGRASTADIASD